MGMRNAEWPKKNAEVGMRNAEWPRKNEEIGMRKVKKNGELELRKVEAGIFIWYFLKTPDPYSAFHLPHSHELFSMRRAMRPLPACVRESCLWC